MSVKKDASGRRSVAAMGLALALIGLCGISIYNVTRLSHCMTAVRSAIQYRQIRSLIQTEA